MGAGQLQRPAHRIRVDMQSAIAGLLKSGEVVAVVVVGLVKELGVSPYL